MIGDMKTIISTQKGILVENNINVEGGGDDDLMLLEEEEIDLEEYD